MKSNLISAIAGWKSAALLALVAMVAAVAFSGVLTSTDSAEAQIPTATEAADGGVTVSPGAVVNVDISTEGDRFAFASDSEGSATFVANGGTSLRCGDYDDQNPATTGQWAFCDTDTAAGGVTVQVKVDDDSPKGDIFVQRYVRVTGGGVPTTISEATITVTDPNPPVAIRVTNVPLTTTISSTSAGVTRIAVSLVDAAARGMGGQDLQVSTTRGVLSATTAYLATVGGSQRTCANDGACTVTTVEAAQTADASATPAIPAVAVGGALVTLNGNNVSGVAEVTFLHRATGLQPHG